MADGNGTKSGPRPVLRCAIYTRKSTEEGLEQEFNSLDAQRESAEAYVRSQRHEGWRVLPKRYDDPGYSGGNMERPALASLLADIKAGQVDCVVVYKVDRLSRSLLDFARIIATFDQHQANFVSVTQQFNTSTSLGRLTLNILLSFAQFEREIIGERTRDKLSAARKKGKWIGGIPVLGYDVAPGGGRLVVNEAEAHQVRQMFELFAEGGSIIETVNEVNRRGWTTKHWTSKRGAQHVGKAFTRDTLVDVLGNPIYSGVVRHKGTIYPGEHAAIVTADLYRRVEEALASRRREEGDSAKRQQHGALLKGLLKCSACGTPMVHAYSARHGRRYCYYVCATAQRVGWRNCPSKSLPARELENRVAATVLEAAQKWLQAAGKSDDNEAMRASLQEAVAALQDGGLRETRTVALGRLLRGVSYDGRTGSLQLDLVFDNQPQQACLHLARRKGRKFIVSAGEPKPEARNSVPRISILMALAIKFEEQVTRGAVRDYADLARLGHVTRARITQIMGLLTLRPDIQERLLFLGKDARGRDPIDERTLRPVIQLWEWDRQRRAFLNLLPPDQN